MVVDIGGGTTECCRYSMGGIVVRSSSELQVTSLTSILIRVRDAFI